MTPQTVSRIPRRLALSIAGLNLVMLLIVLLRIFSEGKAGNDPFSVVAFLLYIPIYSLLAALVISRQPRHTVGWLFLIVGFFSALVLIGLIFPEISAGDNDMIPLLVRRLLAVIGELAWMVPLMIPMSLVLLYFPDGHLPSRRWWPITAAMLIGMLAYAASLALPLETQGFYVTHNPIGIPGSEGFFDILLGLSNVLIYIGVSGSLVAVVVRFFRSSGIERTQMKWLVYAAVAIIPPILLLSQAKILPSVVMFLAAAAPTILSLAIGIAILRYRLWDIDIIIRKTLIYSILTGILALLYFGGVVLAQQVFRSATREIPDAAIVVSTLLIAALFSPLRRRIQNVIDRRFFRRKYDAEQTLARFNQTLRDEVDIETLKAQLVGVVNDTMQPTTLALWVREE